MNLLPFLATVSSDVAEIKRGQFIIEVFEMLKSLSLYSQKVGSEQGWLKIIMYFSLIH